MFLILKFTGILNFNLFNQNIPTKSRVKLKSLKKIENVVVPACYFSPRKNI